MARAQGIPLAGDLGRVAKALARSNTVIGGAFRVLTDDVDGQEALQTSLSTLTRVLDAVDWAVIGKGDPRPGCLFTSTSWRSTTTTSASRPAHIIPRPKL